MLPDLERADRIGEFWGYQRAAPSPAADRLKADRLKEDRTLRAVLVGMLREAERPGPSQERVGTSATRWPGGAANA
jgi:hypothetical protein